MHDLVFILVLVNLYLALSQFWPIHYGISTSSIASGNYFDIPCENIKQIMVDNLALCLVM